MFDYFDQSRMNGQGMVLSWAAELWVIGREPAALFGGELTAFVEASFYLLLRIDRSFVAENGQNGHISKVLRLNQCGERGEGVYKLRRLPQQMTIDDHLHISNTCVVGVNLHK